jgi:hypothetical protein
MGRRKIVIDTITTALHELVITALNRELKAVNRHFDPMEQHIDELPKVAVTGEVHTIRTGDIGPNRTENTLRISILGYTYAFNDLTLYEASEEVIDAIIEELTSLTNISTFQTAFGNCGFHIDEIGPILNEHYSLDQADALDDAEGHPIAFIHIPCAVSYIWDNT